MAADERLDEQRRALPESSFKRLHLNEWCEAEDRLTTLENLKGCATLPGPPEPSAGHEYVLGVDIGIKHDRTVATVCHAVPHDAQDADSWKIVVDRLDVWAGSPNAPVELALVKPSLLVTSRCYRGAKIVIDPCQAAGLAQDCAG